MIVIYGKDSCPWCDRAVELCHQYALDVTYKSLDDRFDGATHKEELSKLATDIDIVVKTVPQVWWHGKYVGGYNDLVAEIENTRTYGDGKI